jgi:hypothetical protein
MAMFYAINHQQQQQQHFSPWSALASLSVSLTDSCIGFFYNTFSLLYAITI